MVMKDLIKVETCKLAKEKGIVFWNGIPKQSSVQCWLRDIHEIHVEVISKKYKTKIATCIPRTFKYIINGTYSLTVYNTYEEALEEGLLQGLKLIK